MELTTTTAWNEFSDHVLNFIRGRVKVKEDAEDILQDVFARIHTGIGGLKDEEKLHAWVFRVARNAIIDFWKSQERSRISSSNQQEFEEEDTLVQAMNDCVQPMIEDLPPKYSEALLLSEMEGLKQQEVANKLGISLSGAKSRIQRGREMLKQSFLDCCNFRLTEKGQIGEGFDEMRCKAC